MQPYGFQTGITDRQTNYTKFGARWYNPTTGNWTQQDTLDTPASLSKQCSDSLIELEA